MDVSLLEVAHVVVALALSVDILLHKHRPASAALWLGVVWAIPGWGLPAYLIFGVDRIRWFGSGEWEPSPSLPETRARITSPRALAPAEAAVPGSHIFRVTETAVSRFEVVGGNRAELLVDGDEFFPALIEACSEAERSIHFQSYIISNDDAAREIVDALVAAVDRGVRVRLLYDRFGSTPAYVTGLFRRARKRGIEVAHTRTWGHLNLRNHGKVVVVDGRVAFVGGMNIDDRNVTGDDGEPPDRDYQVRIRGPVVKDLQLQFLADWSTATRQPLDDLAEPEAFPDLPDAGDALVQVVPGGAEGPGTGLPKAYFGAIASARRSLTIVTPYFGPGEAIFEVIRFAALGGVDVRLVLPRRSNHPYTTPAARALYGPLLKAGVRILERDPPFIHAKAVVVDEEYALLGSANLDYRSLYLNFELNVEIADAGFVGELLEQIEREVAESREVSLEEHESRPVHARLLENLCRLFQPVL